MFTKGASIEVSAFTIVVWYTYRNRSMLKLMVLVRTIVTQASIWFIGIIIAHIYIQANFSGLAVCSFVRLINLVAC